MMLMSGFAEKWRKRQACRRCRRIKVRCEFDSPDSETCTRCKKAGVECQLNPPAGSESMALKSHRRGAKYAWVETKAVYTDAARAQKLAELEQVVEDARAEIAQLRGLSSVSGGPHSDGVVAGVGGVSSPPPTGSQAPLTAMSPFGASSAPSAGPLGGVGVGVGGPVGAVDPALAGIDPALDPQFVPPPSMADADMVAGALAAARSSASSSGLADSNSFGSVPQQPAPARGLEGALRAISRTDAAKALVVAVALLRQSGVPYVHELPANIDQALSTRSDSQILVLALIAIGSGSLNLQSVDHLVTLLGHAIGEKALGLRGTAAKSTVSLDLVRAALLYAQFGASATGFREDMFLQTALGFARILGLGSAHDARAIHDHSHPERSSATSRVLTLLHLYTVSATFGLTNSSSLDASSVPLIRPPVAQLSSLGGTSPEVGELLQALRKQSTRFSGDPAAVASAELQSSSRLGGKTIPAILQRLAVAESEQYRDFDSSQLDASQITAEASLLVEASLGAIKIQVSGSPSVVSIDHFVHSIHAVAVLSRARLVSTLAGNNTGENAETATIYNQIRQLWVGLSTQNWFVAQLHPLFVRAERWQALQVLPETGPDIRLKLISLILNGEDFSDATVKKEEDFNVDPSLAGLTEAPEPKLIRENGYVDPTSVLSLAGDLGYSDLGGVIKDLFHDLTDRLQLPN